MKKLLSIILVATIVLSTILTGCGKKTQEQGAQKEKNTESVTYVNDDLLVSADWLKENLNSNIVIIDARDADSYKKGHVTGAINTGWQPFTDMEAKQPGDKGWGTLLEKSKLSEVISKFGIDDSKTVVVYSAAPDGWGDDGRIAWTLKVAGLKNVKILNGGWKTWEAKGYPTSKDAASPAAASFTITAMNESLNVSTEYLKGNLDKVKIIDAREAKEYEGATDFGEKRGGHIPNAISITWSKVVNADGTIKNQKAIEELMTSNGITKSDEIVLYCTKGIRSAYMSLVLRMAGYNNAKNYDASFYEWAGDSSLTVE